MCIGRGWSLVFVLRPGEVLLGNKKRGFAQGWWNGFGGKVEAGETIEEGAKRELHEESGLSVSNELDHVGVLMFEFVNDPVLLEVHVYRTYSYTGTPIETEEMKPRWFKHQDIPYKDMWPDDKLWYSLMLNGKYFNGNFKFEGLTNLLEYEINEITK